MQQMFLTKIENGNFFIKNNENKIQEVFVVLKNIFYQTVVDQIVNLSPNEECEIIISPSTPFYNKWIDEEFELEIYSNKVKIFNTTIRGKNSRNRSFVLISNKNFEDITKCLIEGLVKYSSIPIIHYTVNYNSCITHPNLTNVYFEYKDGHLNHNDHNQFLLIKSTVLLQSLKDGLEDAIFLDSDIQVKSNLHRIVNYRPPNSNMLVLQKSAWDYVIHKEMYIPGPKLRTLMGLGMPDPIPQPYPHGMTNIVIYNKSHLELFKDWNKLCLMPEVSEILKTEYLHDELLLNCLLWKNNISANLNWFHLNVKSIKDVLFYYYYINNQNKSFTNLNDFGLGFTSQTYIPRNKEDVCMFHCIKDTDTAKKINEIIYREEVLKKQNSKQFFKDKLISFYNSISHSENRILKEQEFPLNIIQHYVDGPFVEILGGPEDKIYNCKFYDDTDNSLLCSIKIKRNHWTRPYQKYYKNWRIEVSVDDNVIFNKKQDFKEQRVLIWFDSSAIGDNIAWIPYVEEFRKKHQCHVLVSTYHNDLFKEVYPNLEFIPIGSVVNDIIASYKIGCFSNNEEGRSLSPTHWNIIPLQKVCADILGIEYKEIKPKISLSKNKRVINDKYVCIGTESTSQAKFWNNSTGWQSVIDYLNKMGYKVVSLKKSGSSNLKNIIEISDRPLSESIDYLSNCEFFIGLGSGLSWMAHALNKPVVLISGFSKAWCEFTTPYRIINENVCNGCFNDESYEFDKSDWNWCPRKQNFICTKSITSDMVINTISRLVLNKNKTES